MGDPGGGGNGASPRSTYKFSNGFLFRTAADSISSISYFGDSLPYLFVKQMCQIGNMERFVFVDNYKCAAAQGGGGDTGSWCSVELVAMEDVELVEDVKLGGDMESWVALVFLDATYWQLKQQEEEEVLMWQERQEKWVHSLQN